MVGPDLINIQIYIVPFYKGGNRFDLNTFFNLYQSIPYEAYKGILFVHKDPFFVHKDTY